MSLKTEEFEGHNVKFLKTLLGKKIGFPRFRQRWLREDHCELKGDVFISASNVQIMIVNFVQA